MKIFLTIIILLVCVPVGIAIAAYQWRTYPMKVSRSQRYHTSEWDYHKGRIMRTLAGFAAPIFLGIVAIMSL